MKNGKVYLVGATKGGVGKSVSSYNLAYSLVKLGKKVLAVEFDSQVYEEDSGAEGGWKLCDHYS